MFRSLMEKAVFHNFIQSKENFMPFPKIGERSAWENLPSEAKAHIRQLADKHRCREFPILPARTYMRFLKDGNRSEFEGLYFDRRRALFALVLDECIRNKGENISAVIDLIWAICEESTWVIHAHNRIRRDGYAESILPEVDQDIYIDLFSAETGSLLAWCVYLIDEKLNDESPIIVRRVQIELKKRLLIPYLTYSDYQWMGLDHADPVNNWNPWINENILAVTLLIEEDPEKRNALFLKIGKSVQRFIDFYAPDGGCDEGPAYFNVAGASFLDCLDLLWRATDAKASIYEEELPKNMAMYIMNAHISGKYYINFADAVCRLTPDGMLLLRAAERMNLPSLYDFAVSLINDGDSEPYCAVDYNVIHRRIANLLEYNKNKLAPVRRPLPLSHAFFGIEVASARENTDGSGLYFAAKGGHNMESHNHNDIGNYIVYVNGEPVLCDIGVETYSRKTFSNERYTIFTMQSGYHNTAIINGCDQNPGYEYKADAFSFEDGHAKAVFSVDISSAYPPDAGVKGYKRRITLDRKEKHIVITDDFDLTRLSTGVALPLISLYEPRHSEGQLALPLSDTTVLIEYDPSVLCANTETILLTDKKLSDTWRKDRMFRTILSPVAPTASGAYQLKIRTIET